MATSPHPFHTPDSTLDDDLAGWLGEHADHRVFDELARRILCGDIVFPADAGELLAEALGDEGLLPAGVTDSAAVAGPVAEQIWRHCETTAEAWADEHTDADRVIEAFESLAERGIVAGVFVDFTDLELTDEYPGGVLIWVDEWGNLDPYERRDLSIQFTGLGEADEMIGRALVDALRAAGLEPAEPLDDVVTVPVVWKWHVGRDSPHVDDLDRDDVDDEFDDTDFVLGGPY
ncbi:hypothetical protein [Corynebacterium halotolerans]|uniref:Uncharacterized protein n=1 Tax=Corynebacterium halotolerans YIM 70093 = DSM 44683 TaxID=1121362 RepID=M1NPE3_9CORY|nr:hypothetical protein [Corynebacterium halotolerans]AGF73258.1 hypothetical protein A605_11290 [Corynebacterium halotolerans YIM 70093 = DSM 44683]